MIARLQDKDHDAGHRPWHLWVAALVVFALYVGGARDFLLIHSGDTDYVERQFGSAGVAYFADYPVVTSAIWATNIVAGLLAPLLLVARSRWATPVAVVAATAQIVLLAVTFALFDRWAALGPAISWFDIAIGVVTTLFAGYCWAIRRR